MNAFWSSLGSSALGTLTGTITTDTISTGTITADRINIGTITSTYVYPLSSGWAGTAYFPSGIQQQEMNRLMELQLQSTQQAVAPKEAAVSRPVPLTPRGRKLVKLDE